jgi:uncharacterized membrane protein
MKVHFLYAMVTVEILIFQFVSTRFLASIPDYVLGEGPKPERVEAQLSAYNRGLKTWNYTIGLGLWLAMTLCAYVMPFMSGVPRLLAITAVSILSSVFFVVTYFRSRSAVGRMAEEMPDTGRRVASLERKRLGRYYSVAWEYVPFILLFVAAMLTFRAMPRLGQPYPLSFDSQGVPDAWGEGMGRFIAILVVQALCAVGFLGLTFWGLVRQPDLSPASAARSRAPEEAEGLKEAVKRRKLRFLMAVKIAIALQFTLVLFVKIETALGVRLPGWIEESPWITTIFLLALFLVFLLRMAGRGRGGA